MEKDIDEEDRVKKENNKQKNRDEVLIELCDERFVCKADVCPLGNKYQYVFDKEAEYCHYLVEYMDGKETPIDQGLKLTETTWKRVLWWYIRDRRRRA